LTRSNTPTWERRPAPEDFLETLRFDGEPHSPLAGCTGATRDMVVELTDSELAEFCRYYTWRRALYEAAGQNYGSWMLSITQSAGSSEVRARSIDTHELSNVIERDLAERGEEPVEGSRAATHDEEPGDAPERRPLHAPGDVARYRIEADVYCARARHAWQDPDSWEPGRLLSFDDGIAVVEIVAEDHLPILRDDHGDTGNSGSDGGRAGYGNAPAHLEGLPVGGIVWVTERWRVLAFDDAAGNATCPERVDGSPDTVFERSRTRRMRFLGAAPAPVPVRSGETEGFPVAVAVGEDGGSGSLSEFVYGVVRGLDEVDRFYVVPRSVAEDTARVVDVVTSCTTWGEVRDTAGDDRYRSLLERSGLDPDDPPGDDETFDPNEVDGLQSVDYPMTHEVAQEVYLPRDLQERFGEWERRMVEGSVLTIPIENGPALVTELERRGRRCEEDVALLAREHDRFEWM